MMRRAFTTIFLVLTLVFVLPVMAQDGGTTIEYGQVVTGEITNENFEIPYKFTGDTGDVIVVEMKQIEPLGDLNSPSVILLDTTSKVLGVGEAGFGDVVFVARLPSSGEYTVLATRSDGRAGDSVGEFSLRLLKPPVLNANEPVQDMVTSNTVNYYIVDVPGTFAISYQKTAGDFHPAITVNSVNEENQLEEVASLSGDFLIHGTVGVETESAIAAEVYIVVVEEALWDFNYEEVTADYTITLTQD